MTLVFSCDYGNGPMLVADTMLSSNKLPKDDFITPGGDIEEAVATKLGIHGHSSKIACFDTFAIGWAGKKSTADSTIGHIRSFHEKQWWNRKELHRVLDRETKSGEVSFILHEIALGETFKTVERRVFGKHLAQGEGSNQILSIGSGAKAVQELLMESPRADHRETLKHSFSLNKPLRSSIEDYLFGISKLITSEASWWASHNCGGMYECCRPELGNLLNGNFGFQRFKFLNNYSLYLWNIREATLEDAKWNPRIKTGDILLPMTPWRRIAVGYLNGYSIFGYADMKGPQEHTIVSLHPPGTEHPKHPTPKEAASFLRSEDSLHKTSAAIIYGEPLKSAVISKVYCAESDAPDLHKKLTGEPEVLPDSFVTFEWDNLKATLSVDPEFLKDVSRSLIRKLGRRVIWVRDNQQNFA